MISDEHLLKYQEIYKKKYNKDISKQDALEQAIKLINLVEAVYKPISKEEHERLRDLEIERIRWLCWQHMPSGDWAKKWLRENRGLHKGNSNIVE